jgi:hypothetical protein
MGTASSTMSLLSATNLAVATVPFNVRKRVNPSMTFYDNAGTAGVISYFSGSWNNNGTIGGGAGLQAVFYLQVSIVGATIINFDYVANAEL